MSVSGCRSEREALETSLFEVQQQLAQLESRREQLEAENQNVGLRCETVTGRWNRRLMVCHVICHVSCDYFFLTHPVTHRVTLLSDAQPS